MSRSLWTSIGVGAGAALLVWILVTVLAHLWSDHQVFHGLIQAIQQENARRAGAPASSPVPEPPK